MHSQLVESSAQLSFTEKIRWYGFFGLIGLIWDLTLTKLRYPRARLLRRPFSIRSKRKLLLNNGFTSGVGLRIDVFHDARLSIGRNVKVNDHVHIAAHYDVSIGENCLIASKVFISDHDHGSYVAPHFSDPHTPPSVRPIYCLPVRIGKNVWIGEGAMVLKGVTIGDGSIVAAGAIVAKDVAPQCIVAGIPAKPVKLFDPKTSSWVKV